jgi:hypothetical protein
MKKNILCILTLLLSVSFSVAQMEHVLPSYFIPSSVQSGGGFSVRSAIGAPVSGKITSGVVSVEAVPWILFDLDMSESSLQISQEAGSVVISWHDGARRWILEHSVTLGSGAVWLPIEKPVTQINGVNTFQVAQEETGFYRLRQQP